MTKKTYTRVDDALSHLSVSSGAEDDQRRPETCQRCRSSPEVSAASHTVPFINFLAENPTVFHAVSYFSDRLKSVGFTKLSERELWTTKVRKGGQYYLERNGSSLIAFVVGDKYTSGNGAGIVAGHIDAVLPAGMSRLMEQTVKPISTLKNKAGYAQLGIAPYAGALSSSWFDRDLGIGGRVLVKNEDSGKIETKLVKLGWPIARIPTLAPHFGSAASGPFNKETEMVPIIGLEKEGISATGESKTERHISHVDGEGTFASTQPARLVKAIAGELEIQNYSSIVNWELELFDTQPGQLGGIDKEFIFAGRIDDKLCSYAALEALIASSSPESSHGNSNSGNSGIIKVVGLFDDEEIGSQLRQGARGNLLSSTMERICEAFADEKCGPNIFSQTYANSFLISADVTHAVNPNFLGAYLENHAPQLNTGVCVQCDSNGHMTTDAVSSAVLQRVAEKCGSKLQVFQIRNDSRSGGTVGPMLSSQTGIRAIDAGLPQLSMHSIRATCGSLDPGIGVKLYKGFFDHFEEVDQEFA
ncbi:MAG: hypothetical protein M1837_006422 [Sclerophora amabilis]|nr:MAG: hypothetical protein M1837_006422 [Sclerophora amabilis]